MCTLCVFLLQRGGPWAGLVGPGEEKEPPEGRSRIRHPPHKPARVEERHIFPPQPGIDTQWGGGPGELHILDGSTHFWQNSKWPMGNTFAHFNRLDVTSTPAACSAFQLPRVPFLCHLGRLAPLRDVGMLCAWLRLTVPPQCVVLRAQCDPLTPATLCQAYASGMPHPTHYVWSDVD